MIDAYKQVDTDVKLVIAGGASHTNDFLEEIKKKASEDDRIIMTGFVQGEELEELYSNCLLYCLPSDVEGMPISLLEAMSYGKMCLVSDIEENVQVIGDLGITFEKSNVKDLKLKLEQTIQSKELVDKHEIQDYVFEKYDWNEIVNQIKKYMEKNKMEEFMTSENLKKLHEVEVEILDEFVRLCNIYKLEYFLAGGTLLGAVRHKGFIPWDDDLDVLMPRNDYEKFLEIANKELNKKYMIDNKNTNPKYYLNFTKIRKKDTIFEQDFQVNYDGPKGIWLDIFPLDEAKSLNNKLTPIQRKINNIIFRLVHYKNGFILGKKCNTLKRILGKMVFLKNTTLLNLQDKVLRMQNGKGGTCILNLASAYDYKRELFEKNDYFPAKELEFEGKKYKVPNQYKKVLEQVYGDYMKLPPKEKQITHNSVRLIFEGEETK